MSLVIPGAAIAATGINKLRMNSTVNNGQLIRRDLFREPISSSLCLIIFEITSIPCFIFKPVTFFCRAHLAAGAVVTVVVFTFRDMLAPEWCFRDD